MKKYKQNQDKDKNSNLKKKKIMIDLINCVSQKIMYFIFNNKFNYMIRVRWDQKKQNQLSSIYGQLNIIGLILGVAPII